VKGSGSSYSRFSLGERKWYSSRRGKKLGKLRKSFGEIKKKVFVLSFGSESLWGTKLKEKGISHRWKQGPIAMSRVRSVPSLERKKRLRTAKSSMTGVRRSVVSGYKKRQHNNVL